MCTYIIPNVANKIRICDFIQGDGTFHLTACPADFQEYTRCYIGQRGRKLAKELMNK